MNIKLLLAFSLMFLWVHACRGDDKPLTGDMAKFQGTWKGETGRDGQYQTVMIFKGHAGTTDNTTLNGDKIGLTYKFDIDEKAKPHKRIHIYDIVRYGGNGSGPDQVYGIYEFVDANTIRFCNGFDGRYPTEFKDGERRSSLLFTIKREAEVANTGK
jgi:hypothetical protein